MLQEVRITAEPHLVENFERETVVQTSAEASLVLLPFGLRGQDIAAPDGATLEEFSADLGVTAYVMAARDLELDAEPEEGAHEDVARALDHAKATEEVAQQAERAAQAAENEVATEEAPDEQAQQGLRETRKEAERARQEAEQAQRALDDRAPRRDS